MPNQSNKQQDEDKIIANAIMQIKEGILSLNWQLIADSYAAISGEKINVPTIIKKETSRLDAIRNMMKATSPLDMNVKDLKSFLLKQGYKASDFKNKKKEQLVEMIKAEEIIMSEIEPPLSIDNSTELVHTEDGVYGVKLTEQDGGRKFGQGKIQVISTAEDQEQIQENQRSNKKKIILPLQRRSKKIPEGFKQTQGDCRYHNVNRPPNLARN